ncbi:MAG: proline--tRNA ligase [Candidatus Parvarchaeum sp.]
MAEAIEVKKESDLISWYNQVVVKSEMVDFSAVKGFAVYRPYGYDMWERSVDYLDSKFKSIGVKNAYFPLLIPESILSKEKKHIEGFNPEVAWVTMGGDTKLDERLAIRPTSETIMYDSYSKWIKSYRDLPLLINQWNTMVRWETKETRLLLRGREVLWQEGHCVFRTDEEADKNARDILDFYKQFLEDMLAVPVLAGRKSESEKFAGAVTTYTVEAVLPNNFMSQAATSHNLGQNFSKPFDIKFLDEKNELQYPFQTSWGISMRSIGVMILVHGDNKGLVLSPFIAPYQCVIIPILKDEKDNVIEYCKQIESKLKEMGIRVLFDSREEYSPGWKLNEYDLKGVPLKIQVGKRELDSKNMSLKTRISNEQSLLAFNEIEKIKEKLEEIHKKMLENAREDSKKRIREEDSKERFVKAVKESLYIVKASWCGTPECEEKIKNETGATSRLIPLENEKLINQKCIFCGNDAKVNAYFAKSY